MANAEHLALVEQGTEAINRFAEANPTVGLDLAGADLSGRDLRSARLMGADLRGANLSGCDLREARLTNVNFTGADLRDADARGASFHHANFTGADLRGIRLDPFGEEALVMCISPTTFQGARWDRQRLEHILEVVNLNSDWQIRYEITPKG
jgi:uncharacterized protein YjbI with pentapeptide repeats